MKGYKRKVFLYLYKKKGRGEGIIKKKEGCGR